MAISDKKLLLITKGFCAFGIKKIYLLGFVCAICFPPYAYYWKRTTMEVILIVIFIEIN
jgi:hypothetical protein